MMASSSSICFAFGLSPHHAHVALSQSRQGYVNGSSSRAVKAKIGANLDSPIAHNVWPQIICRHRDLALKKAMQ